jgi:ERCC4-type nuclease
MNIIVDTHEKMPWDLKFYGYKTVSAHLNCGDYCVEELSLICERKRSSGELSTNLGKNLRQFEEELKKMEVFKHRYIILEFSREDLMMYPRNSGIPKKYWKRLKFNGNYLFNKLNELAFEYNIEILFFKDRDEAEKGLVKIIQNLKELFVKSGCSQL